MAFGQTLNFHQRFVLRFRARSWRVKAFGLWVILFLMPTRSAYAQSISSLPQMAEAPQMRVALDWFTSNRAWIDEQQSTLTEIPAPPFQEGKRAAAIKTLLTACGLRTSIDSVGNVIGEL